MHCLSGIAGNPTFAQAMDESYQQMKLRHMLCVRINIGHTNYSPVYLGGTLISSWSVTKIEQQHIIRIAKASAQQIGARLQGAGRYLWPEMLDVLSHLASHGI